MLCRYTLFANQIHQFSFVENSEAAAEDFVDLWIAHIPPFYYNNPHCNGIIYQLIDMSRSGTIPATTLVKAAKRATPYLKDTAMPGRICYVMNPEPNFIPQIQALEGMIKINTNVIRRFFLANEYDAALQWLQLQGSII
jgi:fructose-specific component phosphotransferase system IIB-like protein